MSIRFTDNSDAIKEQLAKNTKAALHAIGQEGVKAILGQMKSGYGKPIRYSGDLMRDVQFEVERGGENTVDIGSTLDYAPYVHEGHAGHAVYMGENIGFRVLPGGHTAGRPYIRDGIMDARDKIMSTAEEYLKKGF